jgi:hypothetical protein
MIGEGTDALVAILKGQWARVWDMWEETIRTVPDDEWAKGDVNYLIPARQLVHTLVCADVFTADIPLDQYDPTRMFGGGSWGMPLEELPSRETALAELASIRVSVEERLAKFDDAALLAPEKTHLWAGRTRMCKMLYALRHTQHHLGEVSAELSRRGIKAATWEKEKAAELKQ